MSLEEELQQIAEKAANDARNLRRQYEVLLQFGEAILGYEKPFVHFYKLYGRRGSVNFRYNRYTSIANGKNPDAKLLAYLLANFPGVPMVKYRDGCVGFRPSVTGEPAALAAREKGHKVDLYDCGPVTVSIDPAEYAQSAKIEWTTDLGGELWEIQVEFPLYVTDFGRLNLRYNRYAGGRGEICSIERCDFSAHAPWQVLKYARGDHKTPNLFVLYMDPDSARETDYTRFLELPKEAA